MQTSNASALSETSLPGKMRLTERQQWEFQTNGFLVLPNALTSDEVATYIEMIDRADRELAQDHKGPRTPGSPLELRNAVCFDPERMLPLLTHPVAFPYLLDLMGPHITLTTSHCFIRPPSPADTPSSHKQIGWHRDGPTPRPRPVLGMEPWLYTKIGYFLTDLTIPDAGALRVVPGSHRYPGAAPASAPGEESYGSIELKVRPGDAVIFENRVLHAVGPNYTTIPRKNIYVGYCWRYIRPIDYISYPEELLARGTPEQRQLLGDVPNGLRFYFPAPDEPLVKWYSEQTGNPTVAAASVNI